MQEEIWKPIEGLEKYSISSFGRVMHNKSKRIRKPILNKNGYLYVLVWDKGKYKNLAVHRLVAKAFVDNPNGYPEVNHIDGVKTNNRADNLEWCTPKQQIRHAHKNKLIDRKGEKNSAAKLTEEQVREIRRSNEPIEELAKKYGISPKYAYQVRRGYYWKHVK